LIDSKKNGTWGVGRAGDTGFTALLVVCKLRIAPSCLGSLKMTRFWCRITAAGLIENDKKYEKGQKEGKT
jgi:hypothetical protein